MRHTKKRLRRKRAYRIVTIILAAVFLFSAYKLGAYALRSIRTRKVNAELQAIYTESSVETTPPPIEAEVTPVITAAPTPEAPKLLSSYQYIGDTIMRDAVELYAINPDVIGWLNIPDVLSLPVVYRDNSYYLTHDFYGHNNEGGTLFLDVASPLEEENQLLYIHGHAMYDGTMFGKITHYRHKDFAMQHSTISFNTLYAKETYSFIGSIYLEESELSTVGRLGQPVFSTEAEFSDFIQRIRIRSEVFIDESISPDRALLALSTCFNDGRIIAFFQRTASEPALSD